MKKITIILLFIAFLLQINQVFSQTISILAGGGLGRPIQFQKNNSYSYNTLSVSVGTTFEFTVFDEKYEVGLQYSYNDSEAFNKAKSYASTEEYNNQLGAIMPSYGNSIFAKYYYSNHLISIPIYRIKELKHNDKLKFMYGIENNLSLSKRDLLNLNYSMDIAAGFETEIANRFQFRVTGDVNLIPIGLFKYSSPNYLNSGISLSLKYNLFKK